MSVIEDSRKVMQDFLAPELRAISARLDALEKRFEAVDKRFELADRKIDEVDRRAEKRHNDLVRHSDKQHEEVVAAIRQEIGWNSVQQRLAPLESKKNPQRQ